MLTVLASLCLLCCAGVGTIGGVVAYRSHVETERQIECVKNDKPIETRTDPLRKHYFKNKLDFEATYNDKVLQIPGEVTETTRNTIKINDRNAYRVICHFDDAAKPASVANGDAVVVKGYFRYMDPWVGFTQKMELFHCQLVPEK